MICNWISPTNWLTSYHEVNTRKKMRYIGVVGERRGIGNDLLARACERWVISLPCSTFEGFAEISYSNSRPISIVSASISSSFQCDCEMRKHKPFAGHVQTIRFVNWRCQPRSQGLPSSHKREWLLALLSRFHVVRQIAKLQRFYPQRFSRVLQDWKHFFQLV